VTPEQEQATRDEAKRLKLVAKATQREIIAMHRETAADPKVGRADRKLAKERADALETLLGLKRGAET
jgi:hypothetical protein